MNAYVAPVPRAREPVSAENGVAVFADGFNNFRNGESRAARRVFFLVMVFFYYFDVEPAENFRDEFNRPF